MELAVHRDTRIVEIWLTHADQADMQAQEALRQIYAVFGGSGFHVAVFYSGDRDLREMTGALLRYNRRLIAAREAQADRQRAERSA